MADMFFSYTASRQLSQFFLVTVFFHISEYVLAITFHGKLNVTLSCITFLIDKQYVMETAFSLLEYMVEIALFPQLKEQWWINNIGLALVMIGEIIRKIAITTAGRAFTHTIRTHREDHHKLVTHGIYSFIRHPGYCGCLVWATGTQIILCNPLCTVAYMLIVWRFFAKRITYEEYFLRQFFGSRFEEYAQRVPSGVPFVK